MKYFPSQVSSRSHAIFTLTMESKPGPNAVNQNITISKFHLVRRVEETETSQIIIEVFDKVEDIVLGGLSRVREAKEDEGRRGASEGGDQHQHGSSRPWQRHFRPW